jgi:hypothetical protein
MAAETVEALCLVTRMIGDDRYMAGTVYTLSRERVARYPDAFRVRAAAPPTEPEVEEEPPVEAEPEPEPEPEPAEQPELPLEPEPEARKQRGRAPNKMRARAPTK